MNNKMGNRIEKKFAALKSQGKKALVTFITAGDPDRDTSQAILDTLPSSGADIIELGMPFSDPMADGPAIQAASKRALDNHASMKQTLDMVRAFREKDTKTPLILMGYYNPVYIYGTERFATDAAKAGVDGLIIVDLPPEEELELVVPAQKAGLALIHLVTPTTDKARLSVILKNAGGFIYYVSITGITGTATPTATQIEPAIARIREQTDLPVAVGFGIKTPQDIAALAPVCDAVVVGSSIVNTIATAANKNEVVLSIEKQVKALAAAL